MANRRGKADHCFGPVRADALCEWRPEDFTFDQWIAMPVAGSDSCVAVNASLLAQGCSHFVRVSVVPKTTDGT
jgi:hypothetical protein